MKFYKLVLSAICLGAVVFMVSCSQDEGALPAQLRVSVTDLFFDSDTETVTLTVSNPGGSTLRWGSSLVDSWLSLSPSSGNIAPSGATTVTVTVDRSNLPSGFSYTDISLFMIGTGNITEGKVLAESSIPVEVSVLLPPDMELSTSSLNFSSTTNSQSFSVQNFGDENLLWTITSNQTWLTTSPSNGTTGGGQASPVAVNVNRGSLVPGQYTGQLSLSSNGGSATVSVSIDVAQPVTKVLYTQYTSSDNTLGYEIYSMNSDGTSRVNLTNNGFYDSAPAWSPSFNKIAFESSRAGVVSIYTMNANGSQPVRLTSGAISYDPTWSPDETKVAFSRLTSGTDNYEIFVIGATGTGQTQLTSNGATNFWPDWSPDGAHIVFVSNLDGDRDIYIMDVDGSNVTRLTNNSTDDTLPSFSMGSDKIVYSSNEDGDYEIYVMNIDGTGRQKLTNNTDSDIYPSFSNSSDQIIFTSNRDGGNRELYTMSITGSNVTRITTTSTLEIYGDF